MKSRTSPDQLEIRPFAGDLLHATVTVPGSKSITNRALVLAALASQWTEIELHGALQSEDTEVMVDCLRRLDFIVQPQWPTVRVLKNRTGSVIAAAPADMFAA